ncbi:MAG: 16S rRNA (cytidine(1402)-2'-O)-methyltransferase [Thermodesulfobacteriota bacterium]
MPLNSPISNSERKETGSSSGNLFVVATPIGNREDLTLRALRVLGEVNWIAAEDTRHTRHLLSGHPVSGRFVAYHEYNEQKQTPVLIGRLKQGESVALVSNAGTPLVSDPGHALIKAAVIAGIKVVPIPGPSAVLAALSVSALPNDSFIFVGFLPKKKGERERRLNLLETEERTLIFFESPNRIISLLEEIHQALGDRKSVLCREMTKLYEEILRGSIGEVLMILKERPEIKGECTLLVEGRQEIGEIPWERVRAEIKNEMQLNLQSLSEIAKTIARRYGISKRAVYEEALVRKHEQA